MMMSVVRIAVMALALTLSVRAFAQNAPKAADDNPVVARVNGSEIRRSDVLAAIEQLPQQYRQLPPQVLFSGLTTQLVDRKLLSQAASGAKLNNDPEVKKKLAAAEERIVQEVYLSKQIEKSLTEARLKARYEQMVKEQPPSEEIHARHILVDDEAKASKIIEQLKKGADFAALAKENSSGPSANSGGDLGFFSKEQMVPEFSAAAFALKDGQFTDKAVKTQFGWHVIKVEERRAARPPAFEEVRDDVRRDLAQEVVAELVAGLRAKAAIEQVNDEGKLVAVPKADAAPKATPAAPAGAKK